MKLISVHRQHYFFQKTLSLKASGQKQRNIYIMYICCIYNTRE